MKNKLLYTILFLLLSSTVKAQSSLDEYRSRISEKTGRTGALNSSSGESIPSGAVMPFDLGGSCPAGWSVWRKGAGRVIVGTGNRNGSTYRNNQVGGSETTEISAKNIKKERIQLQGISLKVKEDKTPPYVMVADTSVVSEECIDRQKHCTRYPPRPYTIDLGNSDAEPVNNMQPFIALTYCKKN
ncbi:MAG: hypothetical protein OIF36_01490 [Alphaproteobacteria bacterium]|nr:hypothetical protein [Alphaproteobacteria bacterium]